MPYEISWHITGQVALIRHFGTYTVEELRQTSFQILETYYPNIIHNRLNVILDVQEVEHFELTIGSLQHIPLLPIDNHIQWILLLAQKDNREAQSFGMLMGILSHMLRFQLRRINSLDEVIPVLTELDPDFKIPAENKHTN